MSSSIKMKRRLLVVKFTFESTLRCMNSMIFRDVAVDFGYHENEPMINESV